MPSPHANSKSLLTLAKTLEKQDLNFSCSPPFHMETRVNPKYPVNDCRQQRNKITTRNNKKQRGNENIDHIVERKKNLIRNTSSGSNDSNKPKNFIIFSESI